jgi:DNA-binding MarR family transcriptional regulator
MATGHDIAMALRAAYLAMHRQTDACLARHGVTADQLVLLAALDRGDALTQKELASRTASDANTVRAMLLLLENRGIISRTQHATDARARTVTMTPKGKRIFNQLWESSEPIREQLLSALGPREATVLLGILERVTQACNTPRALTAKRMSNHRPNKSNEGVQK